MRRRHYVLNAVKPDREAVVRAKLAETSLEYLGAVPRDDALEETVFRGESVYTLDNCPAVRAVAEIMQRIGAS